MNESNLPHLSMPLMMMQLIFINFPRKGSEVTINKLL